MAKTFSDLISNRKKAREEEERNKISSSDNGKTTIEGIIEKSSLKKSIGLDTFESDLADMGNKINSIYSEWQTPETMANTRVAVESMQKRVNDYATYQKKYMPDSTFDVDTLMSGYQTVLDDWDKLAETYSTFKDAESYKNYPNYQKSLEEEQKKKDERVKALDNSFDQYKYYEEMDDFEERSQYKSTIENKKFLWMDDRYVGDEVYEYINNADGKIRGELLEQHDKYQANAPIYTPSKYAEMGLDYLTEEEKRVFNAIYTDSKESAYKFLDDMKTTLLRRGEEQKNKAIKESVDDNFLGSAALSIASVPMSIGGGIYSGIESITGLITGEDNPYSVYHGVANESSSIRQSVGEEIEEHTEGVIGSDVFGQNIYRFLYDTGMSMADSAMGIAGFGKAFTPIMGMNAYQQKYKEMIEGGEDQETAQSMALASGVAETLFEHLSVEKLFNIKNVDGWKKGIKAAFAQAGFEGSEELFTELANVISDDVIRGEGSDFKSQYNELVARGYSEEEAKAEIRNQFISQLGWAFAGGALSGLGMGGLDAKYQYNILTETGKDIRANDRASEMINVASDANMTAQESETYKLYTEYANNAKGDINADNISDAQLGNLYATAKNEAYDTLNSKKSTPQQKFDAERRVSGLAEVETKKTEAEKSRPDRLKALETGEVTEVKATGNSTSIEGFRTENDETFVQTSEGEFKTSEMTFTTKDAELLSYAEGMGDVKGNLFLSQYDGTANIDDYAKSFNLVHAYGESGFGHQNALALKGVLSERQAFEVYSNAMLNKAAKDQKVLEGVFKDGKVKIDESVIDYTNSGKGEVNWNELTPSQRKSVHVAKVYANALGVDLTFFNTKAENGVYKGKQGAYYGDGVLHVDIQAGRNTVMDHNSYIVPVMSHELTHHLERTSPKAYAKLQDHVMNTLVMHNGGTVHDLIETERSNLAGKRGVDVSEISEELAISELVARSCEDMLSNSKKAKEFLSEFTESERNTFVGKVKEMYHNLIKWIDNVLKKLDPKTNEAKAFREHKAEFEKLLELWDDALVEMKANQKMVAENTTSESVTEGTLPSDVMYNLRLTESHIDNLEKSYSEDSNIELDTLLSRYNEIIRIWKKIGGELDSKFLKEWDNRVGKDRNFTIFKAQAGYKYNVELSSMCKKGVPLFEAIDTIVKEEVMNELNTDTIGKAEKEILYDILKTNHFDIPCAICYVEQARQREGAIIDAFLNGKPDNTGKNKIKLGWNEVLHKVEEGMKELGVDYTFPKVDRSIATDNYTPSTINMDEKTQNAFYEALKKIANEEITRYNKVEKKSRKLVTDVTPSAIKEVFKGTLPSNLKIFKTLFNNPNSRFTFDKDLLYSSSTTQNLAMAHNDLYSLFNSQGGVSGYKTKQGTVVYWGDILGKKWKPDTLRKEGGVRNQSNSDFQMYTLLDQAQMYIDFSAKGFYLQAYTKVLSELKLFGLSKGKINASFIPSVHVYRNADGSVDFEKTKANAGLDEDGNPFYDDIEGINHKEAFMIIEDGDYSKNICGVCIGYSDNHIQKLLDDNRIQLIIGFHDKTDDPDKRYRGARYAKNYNGLNEATKKEDGSTVHIGFNQFVKKAENKFKYNKETKSFEGSITYNGKNYVANDIPRLAADLYLEHCEKKGLNPAYSQSEIDFSKHENYYKLLADFGLYDSNGNYAPHQKVEFNMPSEVPCLDQNGNKQYVKSEDYIKAELEKELKVRDAISEALADKSENGIIPQFVKKVNDLHGQAQHSDRSTWDEKDHEDYNHFSKQIEDVRSGKFDESNNLEVLDYTPSLLRQIGLEDKRIMMTVNHFRSITHPKGKNVHWHGLTDDQVKEAPIIIKRPAIVADSLSRNNSVILISDQMDNDGNPIVIAIATDGKGVYKFQNISSNFMTSMYGKDKFPNFINNLANGNKILYVNNKKSHNLYNNLGLQLPSAITQLGFDTIIQQSNNVVKQHSDRDSDGNTLTAEQMEYFMDSKVRDEDGNLKVMYHGTGEYGFNVFDYGKQKFGLYGEGFYFTDDKSVAEGYATDKYGNPSESAGVYSVYLNIAKPIDMDAFADKDKWVREIAKALDEHESYVRGFLEEFIASESEYRNGVEESIRNSDMFYVMKEVFVNYGLLKYEVGEIATDIIKNMGYDGITHIGGGRFNRNDTNRHRVYIAFEQEQIKNTTNTSPTSDPDIRFSDRYEDAFFDLFDSDGTLAESSAIIEEDVNRLKERLSMGASSMSAENIKMIAKHLLQKADSRYDFEELTDDIKDIFEYIRTSKNLDSNALIAKCKDVASRILADQNEERVSRDYAKMVLREIRSEKISTSKEQLEGIKDRYGEKYNNAIIGRIPRSNNGVSLDSKWAEWSKKYPGIFDANIESKDMLTELDDIVKAMQSASEARHAFEEAVNVTSLGTEIYNQMWLRSTTDAKSDADKQKMKELNFAHRKAIDIVRDNLTNRQIDSMRMVQIIDNLKQKNKSDVKKAKELGQKRMREYKENVQKNELVNQISKKSMKLYDKLITNSKEKHIAEPLKKVVGNLLLSIDYSSKQMLGMKKGPKAGTPTQKDLRFDRALREVERMMTSTNRAVSDIESNDTYYGTVFPETLRDSVISLAAHVELLVPQSGEFVLNQMSIEELKLLNTLVDVLSTTVSQVDKVISGDAKERISTLAQNDIKYHEELGTAKAYDGLIGVAHRSFVWRNILPQFAFKRYGKGAQKIFKAFVDGWGKMAFHAKEILDFTDELHKKYGIDKWKKDVHEFKLTNGRQIEMSVPQMMSLYCLSKREQARRHMFNEGGYNGKGIRVADFKNGKKVVRQVKETVLTQKDVDSITAKLTKDQKAVADEIQKFMQTICSEWGNETSMKLYGIKMMGEEFYFPIKTDSNDRPSEPKDNEKSIFQLINKSFTKAINENATNPIVIEDIFDVFAQHSSDMAKYNALAIPIFDAFRWYSYKGEIDGTTVRMKTSLENAFGIDGKMYIYTFLQDLNGTERTGRVEMVKKFFTNSKVSSVGANLRVAVLQPFSYARAGLVINPVYLTKALMHKPKVSHSKEYCGIAMWKSLGYYDTNIQRGLADQIKHDQTKKEATTEKSMLLAGKMDELTIGWLWNACELEIRDKRKDLSVGTDEFFKVVGDRLSDVIYSTQVVDSTMTRSEFMRSGEGMDLAMTAFMSEPTVSYNILADALSEWDLTFRQTGSKEEAFKKNGTYLFRALGTYAISGLITSLVEAGIDVWRDTEEDEGKKVKYWEAFWQNLIDNANPLGLIPYIKELAFIPIIGLRIAYNRLNLPKDNVFAKSLEKYTVYGSSRTETQWIDHMINATSSLEKLLNGSDKTKGYTFVKNIFKMFSNMSGLPLFNAWREITTITHKTGIWTMDEIEEMFDETVGDFLRGK